MSGFLSSGWNITSLLGGGGGGGVGPTGPQGPAGPAGATGAAGPSGSQGPSGSIIFTGSAEPTSEIGRIGDFYIQTGSAADLPKFFGPKVGGGWIYSASLVGASGSDGTVIYTGSTAPDGATGSLGDFFILTGSGGPIFYGPKTGGGWEYSASLVGPSGSSGSAGQSGSLIYNGPVTPEPNAYRPADYFLNTAQTRLYYGFGGVTSSISLRGDPGINNAGVWNVNTQYSASNVVIHESSSWIYKFGTATSGNIPSATSSYWDLFAGKGDSGSQGSLIIAGGGDPTVTGSLTASLRTQDYFLDTGSYTLYGPFISQTQTFAASSSLRGPVGSIDILTDVSLSSPTPPANSYFKFNGTYWTNTGSIATGDVQGLTALSGTVNSTSGTLQTVSGTLNSVSGTLNAVSSSFSGSKINAGHGISVVSSSVFQSPTINVITGSTAGTIAAGDDPRFTNPVLSNAQIFDYFGSGKDSSLLVENPTPIAGGTYTNITVTGTGSITASAPIVVLGTLDLSNAGANAIIALANNGSSGATTSLAGSPGGNAGVAVGSVIPFGGAGSAGSAGTSNNTSSTATAFVAAQTIRFSGLGGKGGQGGSRASIVAGTPGSNTETTAIYKEIYQQIPNKFQHLFSLSPSFAGQGGSGGTGGAGAVGAAGGGGGGGGGGGRGLYIYARTIKVSAGNSNSIVAKGGNGGNGNSGTITSINGGGGGGGAGGGGGLVVIVYETLTGSAPANLIDASGGNGGNGGNGANNHQGGGIGGQGGYGGIIYAYKVSSGTVTITDGRDIAGSLGAARLAVPFDGTGTAGGSGTVVTGTLA
jgi:hypothetical protein